MIHAFQNINYKFNMGGGVFFICYIYVTFSPNFSIIGMKKSKNKFLSKNTVYPRYKGNAELAHDIMIEYFKNKI